MSAANSATIIEYEASSPSPVAPVALISAAWRRWAVALVCVGLLIRLAIAATTIGTNDTLTWERFGKRICADGFAESYKRDYDLNHPPLPALWAAASYALSHAQTPTFAFLMRLPAIGADVLSCVLLWRIGVRRFGSGRTALALLAAVAFNPALILIGAYHGNTDNAYAALALLAFVMASHQRPWLAGLALGAAMNVKIIPMLLMPALLSTSRRTSDAVKMLIGFALPLLLFVWPTIATDGVFLKRLFLYKSNPENWGILLLIRMTQKIGVDPQTVSQVAWRFFDSAGKWIMLTALLAAAAWSMRRRAKAEVAGALAACLYLVFAPGFGVQYLALPAVLLLAASLRAGVWFAALGGVFLFSTYYMFLNHGRQLTSIFTTQIFSPPCYLGLMPWAIMLIFVIVTMTARRPKIL